MKTKKRTNYPRINFRCSPQLQSRVQRRAEEVGLKPSELIRSIIHQHLAANGMGAGK